MKTGRKCGTAAALFVLCVLLSAADAAAAEDNTAGIAGARDVEAQPSVTALSPADEILLSQTLAERCPDAPYAVRVAMAAVVLRRLEPGSSLSEVLTRLEAEGAFGEPGPSEPGRRGKPLLSLSSALRRFLRDRAVGRDKADRLAVLSLDAVRAAESGADPVPGALSFRCVPLPDGGDLLFDDSREDGQRERIGKELEDCDVIVGNVGFR